MLKQIIVSAAITLCLLIVVAAVKYAQVTRAIAEHSSFSAPPEAVTSITIKPESWPRTLHAIGTLNSSQGVLLSAQEPGTVSRILFESGQRIEKGAVLVEQDTSVEEANLKAALALSEQQRLSLARAQALRAQSAMSAADFESAQARSQEADAAVDSLRASIARKKISAPFAGQAGIRLVNLGQYLAPGTGVVPLHALDPLYLNFSLPQQSLGLVAPGQTVHASVDAFPGETFQGTLTAVNPQVDSATRNNEMQATLPNPDRRLRPGMFVKVTLVLPGAQDVLSVPATSVQYAPYGDSVFVIETLKDQGGKEYQGVRQQVVKLGMRRGDRVEVIEGLQAGQTIVTSGVFKLRPGAAVAVQDGVLPGNELNPRPAES